MFQLFDQNSQQTYSRERVTQQVSIVASNKRCIPWATYTGFGLMEVAKNSCIIRMKGRSLFMRILRHEQRHVR